MSSSLLAHAALVVATFTVAMLAGRRSDPDPSPEWSPAEVIRLQVEALQHNDTPHPDAGIATAYRFASPGNRAATGPLARFAAMVHGPTYRDLLNASQVDFGRIRVEGDRAVQEVTVIRPDGRRATFAFGLSRQADGPWAGCWMTDAVVPGLQAPSGTIRA